MTGTGESPYLPEPPSGQQSHLLHIPCRRFGEALTRNTSAYCGAMRLATSALVGSVAVLALAGCARTSSPTVVSAPPAGTSASVVLHTYLHALVAGDCASARALAASTFSVGNGELCGEVKVSAFSLSNDAARPTSDEVVYSSVLATEGSGDGSVPPGKITWFYDLKLLNGEWKLVGGGSGP